MMKSIVGERLSVSYGLIILVLGVLFSLGFCGCSNVTLSLRERAEIEALNEQGISWSGEWKAGRFDPPVKMEPAVWWSLYPGAGQMFLRYKMEDAGMFDARSVSDCEHLRRTGARMMGFSWIPLVYVFTFPIGLSTGTVIDANRINNLALLRSIKKENRDTEDGQNDRSGMDKNRRDE